MPLSSRAVAVLEEAAELSDGGGLVFLGTRPSRPPGQNTHAKLLRELGFDAVTHGFRLSFKDWARQHDVVELRSEFALAHVEGSAAVATYARDDLREKRRPVTQAWADCISG